MARRKRVSLLENLLELFFELAGIFWQVGAILSIGFLAGGLYSIPIINQTIANNRLLTILANQHSWFFYLIPLMFFILSFIFGMKAVGTYQKQNYRW
ncbi:MAG: hypothetical protein RL637_1708 [Pseudomonadota bacterium]|jgi:hypothetical protein